MGRAQTVLAGVVLVVAGIAAVGFVVDARYLAVEEVRSSVETTGGTVESSTVVAHEYVDSNPPSGGMGRETGYYPQVTYSYEVDGRTYTGDRIYASPDRFRRPGGPVGREFDDRSGARQVAGRYPEGSTVTVYYYPADPGRSFLVEPTVNWPFVGGVAVAGVVLAAGGLVVLYRNW